MTAKLRRLGLVAVLALLVAPRAHAGCTTTACPDQVTVDGVRGLVAAACDCTGVASHGKYVRCAKQIVKAAIRDAALPRTCKAPVLRCEGESTCGRKGAKICCALGSKGKVKARMMHGGKCAGSTCENRMALVDACTTEGACSRHRGIRSFRSVQQVFKTSCALASCHSAFARKGGLVLDSEDVSYASLVDRPSVLPEAVGTPRVKPGDPDGSFLMQKLLGTAPGDPMPQAGRTLPGPVIDMIGSWIARGALSTAEECKSPGAGGENLCDDDPGGGGDYHWEPLPPLDPPPAGEGIQLHLPPRDVPSGTEWEMCYAFRPNWTEIAALIGMPAGQLPVIREQVYRMHEGSHHLLLYAYFGQYPEAWPEGYFPCSAANCINPGDCPSDAGIFTIPIGGTQVAGTRYEVNYPTGVGVPVLGPNMVLIGNPHFTNPFQPAQPIYGEEWLNLYFYEPGEFKAILDGIFAINYPDLIVEPYETRTISSVWQPRNILSGQPVDAALFQLFGHMHKRGVEFQIDYVKGGQCSRTGRACGRDADCACKPWQQSCQTGQACVKSPGAEDTTIYYTTAWDEAPIMDFQAPYFLVNREDGLRWTCTHTNGIAGDAARPPKTCDEGCEACGWDAATRTCVFTRGVSLGVDPAPRVYGEGDPMPLVFGLLAGDDMCNMFGYFINQASLPLLE